MDAGEDDDTTAALRPAAPLIVDESTAGTLDNEIASVAAARETPDGKSVSDILGWYGGGVASGDVAAAEIRGSLFSDDGGAACVGWLP